MSTHPHYAEAPPQPRRPEMWTPPQLHSYEDCMRGVHNCQSAYDYKNDRYVRQCTGCGQTSVC